MNKHKQAFSPTLTFSSLLVATVTAFSAQAAMSPGYSYDASGKVEHDSGGKCILTSAWNKDNATKECHPELFPEPKVVAPAPAPAPVVAPAPEPAPVVVAPTPKVMVFEAAALFAVNKSNLTPAGEQKIKEYREQTRAEMSEAKTVKITGHTDSSGTPEYNQKLSVRRAEAVRDYLISIGADASKMEVAGMGEDKPIADNKTAKGRAQNRRVEVEVIGYAK
ncbi:OmpA family protein [Sulfuricaulis sp.]|jgi:OOP family OmpA-OmpF porin|uniref:OmpA family protein n=1 Tax=Sulfuricaulis sp. TaxID=2003553 RepID=UPI003559E6E3